MKTEITLKTAKNWFVLISSLIRLTVPLVLCRSTIFWKKRYDEYNV